MSVIPLTAAQERAVEALLRARRLERVPADVKRCEAFLAQARTALDDLSNVRHAQNRYNLAYDAAHDIGEAVLAAYGYRTRNGIGQHDALGRFLAAVFDSPPEDAAAQHYDRLRRDRNRQRYSAQPITSAAAAAAASTTTTLYRAALARVSAT